MKAHGGLRAWAYALVRLGALLCLAGTAAAQTAVKDDRGVSRQFDAPP